KDINEHADEVIEEIGLQKRRNIPAAVLSYAEQRALEIGITVASGARVVLLDEPTAGMSNTETEEATALIRKVSQGRTLMMVDHDQGRHAPGACDRHHPLRRARPSRPQAARGAAPRRRLRARAPRHLPDADRRAEPAAGREGGQRQRPQPLDDGGQLPDLPPPA